MKPGIYDAVPAARYYRDDLTATPTLNATVCKLLIKASPRHAWTAHPKLNPDYKPQVAVKFDLGSVAHEIFLLDDDSRVAIADFDDWRTAAARAVRDQAREEGMVPLLAHQWAEVHAMLAALREQVGGHEADPPLFADGKAEQTVVWRDRGVLCRCRIDWLRDDLTAIDDLKTTKMTAHPQAWARRTLWSIGADTQAAFYVRGVKTATGAEPEFRFALVECHPPYAMSVVAPSPAAMELANLKIDAALDQWATCLATGVWTGYDTRVVEVEPPPWAWSDIEPEPVDIEVTP